jgi:hypothetical protein
LQQFVLQREANHEKLRMIASLESLRVQLLSAQVSAVEANAKAGRVFGKANSEGGAASLGGVFHGSLPVPRLCSLGVRAGSACSAHSSDGGTHATDGGGSCMAPASRSCAGHRAPGEGEGQQDGADLICEKASRAACWPRLGQAEQEDGDDDWSIPAVLRESGDGADGRTSLEQQQRQHADGGAAMLRHAAALVAGTALDPATSQRAGSRLQRLVSGAGAEGLVDWLDRTAGHKACDAVPSAQLPATLIEIPDDDAEAAGALRGSAMMTAEVFSAASQPEESHLRRGAARSRSGACSPRSMLAPVIAQWSARPSEVEGFADAHDGRGPARRRSTAAGAMMAAALKAAEAGGGPDWGLRRQQVALQHGLDWLQSRRSAAADARARLQATEGSVLAERGAGAAAGEGADCCDGSGERQGSYSSIVAAAVKSAAAGGAAGGGAAAARFFDWAVRLASQHAELLVMIEVSGLSGQRAGM